MFTLLHAFFFVRESIFLFHTVREQTLLLCAVDTESVPKYIRYKRISGLVWYFVPFFLNEKSSLLLLVLSVFGSVDPGLGINLNYSWHRQNTHKR